MGHFDSMADVNEWHEGAKKWQLQVQLTGREATVFWRLLEADWAMFVKAVASFTKKFEPECWKELYNG